MFGLALLFVYVFFCPFSILITLHGEEGAGLLCLSCICLLAMHTLICVTFSLPPGVGGWLRLLLVALPGLFYLPFLPYMHQPIDPPDNQPLEDIDSSS